MNDILLLTGHDTKYNTVAAYSEASKDDYAKQHNYYRMSANFDNLGYPASWGKIPALLELLPKHEWVMWSDADALVMNPEIHLTQFLNTERSLVISEDAIGINLGNFMIRRTPWSLQLLQDIWNMRDPYKDAPYWEQSAMMKLFEDPCYYRSEVAVLPKRSFNSYPNDYEPGDFMLHFPGVRGQDLIESLVNAQRGVVLREYFAQTEQALRQNAKQPRLYSQPCTL